MEWGTPVWEQAEATVILDGECVVGAFCTQTREDLVAFMLLRDWFP